MEKRFIIYYQRIVGDGMTIVAKDHEEAMSKFWQIASDEAPAERWSLLGVEEDE